MTLRQFNIMMIVLVTPIAVVMAHNFYAGYPVSQEWLDTELTEIRDAGVRARLNVYLDLYIRGGEMPSRRDFYRLREGADRRLYRRRHAAEMHRDVRRLRHHARVGVEHGAAKI